MSSSYINVSFCRLSLCLFLCLVAHLSYWSIAPLLWTACPSSLLTKLPPPLSLSWYRVYLVKHLKTISFPLVLSILFDTREQNKFSLIFFMFTIYIYIYIFCFHNNINNKQNNFSWNEWNRNLPLEYTYTCSGGTCPFNPPSSLLCTILAPLQYNILIMYLQKGSNVLTVKCTMYIYIIHYIYSCSSARFI